MTVNSILQSLPSNHFKDLTCAQFKSSWPVGSWIESRMHDAFHAEPFHTKKSSKNMRNCKNKQHFMREFIDKGGTVGTDVWFPTKINQNM